MMRKMRDVYLSPPLDEKIENLENTIHAIAPRSYFKNYIATIRSSAREMRFMLTKYLAKHTVFFPHFGSDFNIPNVTNDIANVRQSGKYILEHRIK